MKTSFEERLNQILPRLASPDVLDNRGAGGEIGFWIFDYPPEQEMQMRSWLADVIEPGLHKLKPGLRFGTVDLFECVISLLEERGLLTKAFDMQLKQGDEAVLKSLRSVLKEDRLAARIVEMTGAADLDLRGSLEPGEPGQPRHPRHQARGARDRGDDRCRARHLQCQRA